MMRAQVFGVLALVALTAAFPTVPLADTDEPLSPPSDEPASEESGHQSDLNERLVVPSEPLRHHVLSLATGQFVAITKSGRVHANAQIDRLVAQFYVTYSLVGGREYISFQSIKYEEQGWFLILRDDGKLRGGVPSNGNEVFEVISLDSGMAIALKAPDLSDPPSGSGDADISGSQDCYVAFSTEDGRPFCYDSTEHTEVRLQLIDSVLQ